jgi:hypothetical protein
MCPARNPGIVFGNNWLSSSLSRLPGRGPHQIRTRRFPPSGSSGDTARGVPLPSGVGGTCDPTSTHWACFPPKVRVATGRLCSAGFGGHPVSRRQRSYAALRLPCRPRPRLRSPLPLAYPEADAFRCRPCVRSLTRGASEACGLGLPLPQGVSGTVRGLPGYWVISVPRATARHPAGCGNPSPTDGVAACCLQSY